MAEGTWLVRPEQDGQDENQAGRGRGGCGESRTAWQRELCRATDGPAARKVLRVHSHAMRSLRRVLRDQS